MSERQMLANEIHDSIAQTLAYTKMRLSLLQDAMTAENTEQSFAYLDEVREAMDTAYSSLRQLLANFRNRMDPRGLLPALQDTISMIRGKTGIDIQFVNRAPDMILTPDQEVQVFHIVQEALANIGKHSQASRAKVQIDSRRDDYVITIEDNGVGVPASDIPGKGVHFGMNIMRERAQRLSGTVSVARRPRKGTRIRLTFPAALCRQETRS